MALPIVLEFETRLRTAVELRARSWREVPLYRRTEEAGIVVRSFPTAEGCESPPFMFLICRSQILASRQSRNRNDLQLQSTKRGGYALQGNHLAQLTGRNMRPAW